MNSIFTKTFLNTLYTKFALRARICYVNKNSILREDLKLREQKRLEQRFKYI